MPTALAPPESPADRMLFARIAWRLLPFLFVLYVVSYLDRVNVSFAGLQMKRDLAANGFGDAVYGIGGGIFFLGYFLFEIPSNLILERVGARAWICRIMLTWGVISACMMFVRGPKSFYLLRFLLGLAEAGFFPGVILYLTYWFPATRRARAVALFMTATAASGVIGSLISYKLLGLEGRYELHGWQWLFMLEGLPAILLGIVVVLVLPNGPRDARWLDDAQRDRLAELLALEDGGAGHHRATDLAASLRHRRVWHLTGIYFCITVGLYGVSLWVPGLIKQAWSGHSDQEVSLMSAIPYGCAVVAMVLVSRHSDRTGERRWHAAGSLFVGAAGAACSALVHHNPPLAVAAFSVAAMGIFSVFGPFWSMPPAFLAGTAAAAGIALVNSVGNLGGLAGSSLFGLIKEHTGGFAGALWTLAAVLAAGGVLVLQVNLPRVTRGFDVVVGNQDSAERPLRG
ncbi:MAG: major facilitator superfamily 1 [Phycisphaerales bacterium]|nr:major facilitator superfamily 1 [Phycisphaerales bacterium]MDB5354858.1 major facilitator superfamily 1 [Phycisphaerales bacterium]